MDKNKRILTYVIALIVLAIGVTFAYFVAQTGDGAKSNVNIKADSVDDLKFSVNKDLSLSANQFNFAQGSGNLSDSVTATASLKANSTKKTATYNYYVYFQMESNEYKYTTENKLPEIVLSITGPNGEITNVDGLTYVSASDADGNIIKGFDITELGSSIIKIADSFEISSSSSTNYTNQEWVFKVTFINLNTDQTGNQGKTMSGKVLMQKDKLIRNITDVAESGDSLNSAIVELGSKGDSSITGLYHHDGTIKDSEGNVIDAEDNSYRYAGASSAVKNYICLGSNDVICPAENMYRIIGVFGEINHDINTAQLVKVVKNTSYGNLKWNTTRSSDWATTSLNETLNSTFKTEKLSELEDKIAEVSWKVSGYGYRGVTAKTFYTEEIVNATKRYTGKIGLIYASDYGFATIPKYWTIALTSSSYGYDATDNDWLSPASISWTISPYLNDSFPAAWSVASFIQFMGVTSTNLVYPSFYLTSSVQYNSGSGTMSDPIRLKN